MEELIANKYKKCSVDGCDKFIYSKSLCRSHYERMKSRGTTDKKEYIKVDRECCICKKIFTPPFQSSKQKTCSSVCGGLIRRGSNNVNWNGGSSVYKDHYTMKKNKSIKIEELNGKCEICKNEGTIIHHKDGSKHNHSLDNLQLLCSKCHGDVHSDRDNKTSKFIRVVGYKLSELKSKFNLNVGFLNYLISINKLKEFIEGDEDAKEKILKEGRIIKEYKLINGSWKLVRVPY